MIDRAPRVLVVDDTEGNRYATSRLLRSAGFDVRESASGVEALEAVRDHPDLIVLDVNLPDMTGFEVVERMRRSPEFASIPVLHLSASFTSNADRARGLDQGADAFLTHPIDPTVFVATVRALIRASTADRRTREAMREWQATFDALPDAVVLLDPECVVTRANRAAMQLFGHADRAVLGAPLRSALEARFGEAHVAMADDVESGTPITKAVYRLGEDAYEVTTDPVTVDGEVARTVCIMADVSERFAAEQEREALLLVAEHARLDAEAANRAKSEFLAVMSHELRTPLNAIGGYAQLLELGIRGPVTEQQRVDLERIMRSQTYLLSLINDVLNFAKIESGHVQVELEDVPVDELVGGTSDFVRPQLRERGLAFSLSACPPSLRVRADREKVQQILLNLLSNALKFTPSGGEIALSCLEEGGFVSIAVRDTGLGIALEKLASIFEPFVQVDRRFKREQEGIGLGLAISRELARAMDGDLTVESSEGAGSTFVLRLPKAV
ncbi:MAG TPA: ATP-binding protein [Gemmatimonadaceae bacterium]